MQNLNGIFPALITPFNANNTINHKVLREIVNININKGINGFYVGGSTGEAFLLSLTERKDILETVVNETENKKSISVICHVGCISTDDSIELARHAEKTGADAISSIPPFYYDFSFKEIKNHFFNIIKSVNLPMIIYNFPGFSGVNFDYEDFEELLKKEQIIGVKHTSFNLYQMERFKKIDEELVIFNGHDEVFLGGLAMGADGAIGSTYNFMAEKFIKIEEEYNKGNLGKAQKIQKEVNDIIDVIGNIGVNPAVKYILNLQGFDCGESRRPFKTLNEEEKESIEKIFS